MDTDKMDWADKRRESLKKSAAGGNIDIIKAKAQRGKGFLREERAKPGSSMGGGEQAGLIR